MRRILVLLLVLSWASAAGAQARYYPERFDWQRRTPAQAGMDAAAIEAAVKFAVAHENPAPKDLALARVAGGTSTNEPFDDAIGPLKPRSALNGLIIKNGYVVADWGDTRAVDMTFSVTKTFLSTVVGLAWQKGLIRDVSDKGARLHAAGRGSVRRSAQSAHYLGAPAAANERLERRALGQARLGRSA